jgi:hypothetical protein
MGRLAFGYSCLVALMAPGKGGYYMAHEVDKGKLLDTNPWSTFKLTLI